MMDRIRRKSVTIARRLAHSRSGAAVIEFALLGPLFLMVLFGVLQVGIYLQNYNAVQSLASDGARFVMVEYQKENQLDDDQIRSVMLGLSTNAPYLLNPDRLNITVTRAASTRVTGATRIQVAMAYRLSDFIPGVDLPLSVIRYNRSVWVVPNPT